MNCPSCSTPFQPLRHARLPLVRCSDCKGLWFDENELKSFLSHSRAGIAVDRHQAVLGKASEFECPRCDAGLLMECRRRGIRFLKCGSCAGMFVSAKSLRQLEQQDEQKDNEFAVSTITGFASIDLLLAIFF